jgi:hypothetical protein
VFYKKAGNLRSHEDIPWEMEALAEGDQDSAFVMEGIKKCYGLDLLRNHTMTG